jgi:hypothetical protein
MAKPASEILRDYVTDGVPASGVHSPIKRDLREWAEQVEDDVTDLGAADTALAADIAEVAADVAAHDERIDVLEDAAGGSLIVKPTWAALSTVIGEFDGQAAEVPASDAGTHTDPVVGGTVANAGRYSWVASTPSGWQWISADALTGKADKATTITGAGLATGGGDLSANRTITVPKASEAEAVTGTDDTKAVTPLGVKAAVVSGFGDLTERLALYGLVERRKWPAVPSLSAIAIPDQPVPTALEFSHEEVGYRVNAEGYLALSSVGQLRHDYHPNSGLYRGWLLEPASTNLLRQSNTFPGSSGDGWTKSAVTATSGATTGPDGETSGASLVESTATSAHVLRQTVAVAPNVERTWSIWLKTLGRRYVRLVIDDPDADTNYCRAAFDIVTGEALATLNGGNGSGASARAVVFPGGWVRISLTGTPNNAGTNTRVSLFLMTHGEITGSTSYTGDGTSGVYPFGAQFEPGPEATSYIPTTTVAVSRPADVLSVAVGSWFNPASGSFYLEFEAPVTSDLALDDGTSNEVMRLVVEEGQARFQVVDGGVEVADVSGGNLDQNTGAANRMIGLWEANNIGASLNANAVSIDPTATLPTITHLRIAPTRRVHIRHIAVFARRVADSDARIITLPDVDDVVDDDNRLEYWATRDGFVLAEFRASDGSLRTVGQQGIPKIPEIDNVWTGGVTSSVVKFAYDIVNGNEDMEVRERITSDDAGEVIVSTGNASAPTILTSLYPEPYYNRSGSFTGLTANTRYYLWSNFNGTWHQFATFKTLPTALTPATLTLICSSCQRPKTQREYSSTYVAMLAEDALLHVQLGDYHYGNIAIDDIRYWRRAMRFMCGHINMQPFHRLCPVAYMPDDHDTGPNNFQLNKNYPGTSARQIVLNTQTSYNEWPHYDFVHQGSPYPSNDTVMTQEWATAHIWNILVDSRSQREYAEPLVDSQDMDGTALGNGTAPTGSWDQVTALKNMILAAGAAGYYAIALWFPVMWGKFQNGLPITESWWAVAGNECIDFQEWLRDTPGIPQVYLFTGDNHNKGADDGRKTDITPDGGLQVPQFLCSASHHRSRATLPDMSWNSEDLESYHNDRGYGLVEFDTDGHVTVTMKGAPELGLNEYDLEAELEVLGTYSSDDVTPEVQFSQASMNASPSSTVEIPFEKSWFGPPGPIDGNGGTATVDYSTNEGSPQTGEISIRPNCGKYVLELPTPSSGSFVVTLTNPSSGLTLGSQTTCTVTIV